MFGILLKSKKVYNFAVEKGKQSSISLINLR